MDIKWVDGFEIRISTDGGTSLILANREGLLSLARQLTLLAEQPSGSHIHFDKHNSLEDGSYDLLVPLMIR